MAKLINAPLRIAAALLCFAGLMATLPGCALGVMAGKMLFGDPKIESAFKARTDIDLTKGEKKIVVVCKTPYSVENQMPTLRYDLNYGILQRLKQHGIKTGAWDKVASWVDEHGGEVRNPKALAQEFDADFISIVEVHGLKFYEENSPDMLRGNAYGNIRVYELRGKGEDKDAFQVYSGEFSTQYPQFSPVSIHQVTERTFQKQFVDHLSTSIARHFHDYRVSEGM